jgi:alkylated DNA nucleotide flippase Atl1
MGIGRHRGRRALVPAPQLPKAAAILLASAAVRRGEWISYGEISVAVFGHRGGARAVGRLAARDAGFQNAHRVIGQGGRIPAAWGGGGDGPERCRRRLEAEGVKFSGGGADPARRVQWRTIEQRMHTSARRRP